LTDNWPGNSVRWSYKWDPGTPAVRTVYHESWERPVIAQGNIIALKGAEVAHPRRKAGVHLADSAVETAVGQIKELIETRNLSVGDPLPSERELAEIFTTSRTTVREAMRILKTYGVVEVRPKVGAVLIDRRMDAVFDLYSFNTLELSLQTFLDTQGFRRLIELGAIDTLFEKATPDDIVELRAINDAMAAEETIEKAALRDFSGILGNQQIADIYRIMKPVMLKIMVNGINRRKFGATNYNEHAGIVDALEARNRFAYQYRVATHLEAALALFKDEDAKTDFGARESGA
jgi:GntR family transcriptional repressor for pyruvate dehydrogenase complex